MSKIVPPYAFIVLILRSTFFLATASVYFFPQFYFIFFAILISENEFKFRDKNNSSFHTRIYDLWQFWVSGGDLLIKLLYEEENNAGGS